MDDLKTLRARDFWGALGLAALSVFFIWKTLDIPLGGGNGAGVNAAAWYTSAAIVPLGIFSGLLILSLLLLAIAVRAGGARHALSAAGIGWNPAGAARFTAIALILFFYIAGLVPRVDFTIASGLLITALIFGFHGGHRGRAWTAAAAMTLAGGYALAAHLPQTEWNAHDDDWLALAVWAALSAWALWRGRADRVARITPLIAVLAPLILVCAMAFGFRQNVPARGGLIFSQIEYAYYVHIRPLWRG